MGHPENVHLFVLAVPAVGRADRPPSKSLAAPGESLHLTDAVLYGHASDGIGRAKLVERIGKFVPVEMTARTLRTALKSAELARDDGSDS